MNTLTLLWGLGNCRRPGILVLINDTDWELEGELDYEIQKEDNVMFISSKLHPFHKSN